MANEREAAAQREAAQRAAAERARQNQPAPVYKPSTPWVVKEAGKAAYEWNKNKR